MKSIIKVFLKLVILSGFLFFFAFILLWNGFILNVPSTEILQRFKLSEATEIYSSDSVLLGKLYKENRKCISIQKVPDRLIKCLIATEDVRYFEHSGVDFIGLIRVFYKTLLLGEKTGGGSTITQQLVKNWYPRNNFSYSNIVMHKLREWFTAFKLERLYTKTQILEYYFNTVPFGHNTFGIYTAAGYYFGKTPYNLEVEEMAILVGLLKGTTLYDPERNPSKSKERRNLVLSNMYLNGFLNEKNFNRAVNSELRLIAASQRPKPLAPFFLQHLRSKVEEILQASNEFDLYDTDVFTDGLTIYTTLNSRIQQHAEKALTTHLDSIQKLFDSEWTLERWKEERITLLRLLKLKRYPGYKLVLKALKEDTNFSPKIAELLNPMQNDLTRLRSGFTCIKNTGEVLAWVGGRDFGISQYDHVKSKRQVGSVFKPIVYATAVDQGVNICNYFPNNKRSYSSFDDWEPKNASNFYTGEYTMKGALTFSLNVISVQVLFRAGLYDVLNVANQMGITAELPPVPSISLGTPDISLYEMVNAYTCFPNDGKRVHTKYLNCIELATGKIIYKDKPQKSKEIFSSNVAAVMTNMMESVVNWGTGLDLRNEFKLSTPIAGKTGTTQNQADGWFIGYTPQITAGAWVGADNPGIHFKSIKQGSGSKTALPIWALFAQNLQQDSTLSHLLEGSFTQPYQRDLNCLNQAYYRESKP